MIPDAARLAAQAAYTETIVELRLAEGGGFKVASQQRRALDAALEAAAPHMQELQWGVRDRASLHVAGHPSKESARGTAAVRPEWYEVVSRPMPGLWTTK